MMTTFPLRFACGILGCWWLANPSAAEAQGGIFASGTAFDRPSMMAQGVSAHSYEVGVQLAAPVAQHVELGGSVGLHVLGFEERRPFTQNIVEEYCPQGGCSSRDATSGVSYAWADLEVGFFTPNLGILSLGVLGGRRFSHGKRHIADCNDCKQEIINVGAGFFGGIAARFFSRLEIRYLRFRGPIASQQLRAALLVTPPLMREGIQR